MQRRWRSSLCAAPCEWPFTQASCSRISPPVLEHAPSVPTPAARWQEGNVVAPMLLLPVRIETRFMDTQEQPQLWVRIYPDHFAIDTHEPGLSPDEQAAGQ